MSIPVLPVVLALAAAAAAVPAPPPERSAAPASPAVPFAAPSHAEETVIEAPIQEVWKVWSTPEGWRIAGVAKAELDFRPGGLIRTHYREDGVIGDPGTIENRVLAYEPPRMLAIQIAKPPATFPFPNAWREPWTVITLTDRGDGTTNVRVASVGFGDDEESRKMLAFFEKGNHWTLQHIQEHFAALRSAGKK